MSNWDIFISTTSCCIVLLLASPASMTVKLTKSTHTAKNLPEKLAMCVHSSITPFMKLMDSLCKDRSQHFLESVFFSFSWTLPWRPLENREKRRFASKPNSHNVSPGEHVGDKYCVCHAPLHEWKINLHHNSLLESHPWKPEKTFENQQRETLMTFLPLIFSVPQFT